VEDIFNWFASKYSSDPEEMKTQLFVHGFDIFYEINDSLQVEKFNKFFQIMKNIQHNI
jgi:hypothetical protein